jgi:RHS repeat-associated protein
VSGNNGLVKTNVYDQSGQLLFSSAKQGTSLWTTRFVYLGGKLIAETDANGVTTYEHTDALGSPVARTSAAGQLLSRTRYEPYGGFAAGNYNPGSTGLTDLGFTGHVNDPDTGLVYMQQRYFDPIAGRFMSVDPVVTNANTGKSFSRYEYASNNPYRFIDPDGRDPKCSAGMSGCTVYYGKPQQTGTPGHDVASQRIGEQAARQGAAEVHYNRSLSAVTGDRAAGQQRPDVSVVWKDGKVSTVEVVSGSQTVSSQASKGQAMQFQLAAIGRAGNENTLTVQQGMSSPTIKAMGALNVLGSIVRAIEVNQIEKQQGGTVPFITGLYYMGGFISREQVVESANGGLH